MTDPERSESGVVFLIMRQMRFPLMTLVTIYALAIFGMTLVPGMDDEGNLWYMDFFHAFYFVSYMATTIGFGEIPYTFSEAQRMWATVSMYMTVVAWLYAIGALLALLRNPALVQAITENTFAGRVRRLRTPFYLICGYGDTGRELVNALERRGLQSVVIERDIERINVLTMENHAMLIPGLQADSGKPNSLIKGGLQHPRCAAVVAMTHDNLTNLQIAITAKLLNPSLKVICRVDSADVAANMASFGTDYRLNPFDIFAAHLHSALKTPALYLLHKWMTSRRGHVLDDPTYPPRRGLWVICGYGRFGKSIYDALRREPGIRIVVIEVAPAEDEHPHVEYVIGRGTEADTLIEAHIKDAVGVVAGTDDDVNNLSIVMTARELNENLFVVLRQNRADNRIIINAANADIVMQPGRIIADDIRAMLTTPLLANFMHEARKHGEDWACELVARIIGIADEKDDPPSVWETVIDEQNAPAICKYAGEVKLKHILTYPETSSNESMARWCIPLLICKHDGAQLLTPELDTPISEGDTILWCGDWIKTGLMSWNLKDTVVLASAISEEALPRGYVWRWLQPRFKRTKRKTTAA